MKRKAALILTVILLISALAGCKSGNAGDTGENSGEIKALIVMPDIDTFRQMLVDEATAVAGERGIQLDVLSASSSDEQVEMIKDGVSQGYDIILCNPADANTALQLEIAAGDLPIVFINSCPKESLLKEGKYVYAGSNEEEAGNFQAEYILNALQGKEELNVMVLKGEKGHSATNGRTSAVKKTLNASGKKINYVFEDYADWDTEKAKNMFNIFLKTQNSLDCVVCNNDSMALGIIEACKENNIDPSSVLILGVDATAEGCQAITDGEMSFTVCQSAAGQGKACIDAVETLLSGGNLADVEYGTENGLYVYVPFEPVSAENVSDYQ